MVRGSAPRSPFAAVSACFVLLRASAPWPASAGRRRISASSTSCAQASSLLVSARSTSCLTARSCDGMHREAAQAQAEQQARELRRRPPSRRTPRPALPCASALGDGVGDQAQHRRVQRVVEVRDRVVGAVDGERVLDQVVGADRQEVEALAGRSAARAPRPGSRSCRRPRRRGRRRMPRSSSCGCARGRSAPASGRSRCACASIGISRIRTLP